MVLSLVNICRASLRNAVESGPLPYLHFFVPPKLRQSVLDMVMMHGTVNTENCVKNLGSSNFLRGLWSLDMQEGVVNDSRYLDEVAQSMSVVLENGERIGSGIKNLKLNLYFIAEDLGNNFEYNDAVNFSSVVRLIAQCQNLASLDLRFVMRGRGHCSFLDPTSGGLLNETEALRPCLPILKNLSEFSLNGTTFTPPVLDNSRPIIKFEKLVTLCLENCVVYTGPWRQLLQCIQGTLAELRTKNVLGEEDADGAHVVLPFPLPHLKMFKMERPQLEYSQEFVENLSQCEKLDYALLELDARTRAHITDAQLDALASNAALRVNLHFGFYPEHLDRIIRMTELFSGRVESLMLASDLIILMAPENTPAFKRIIDLCSNLTALRLYVPDIAEGESKRQLAEAMRHLRSLFSNQERASKLRTLELIGDFDYGVLKSLFENCLWLDSLTIYNCPQVCDDHLIEWASRGARPRMLSIHSCENISDEGLVPILISSGSQLLRFSVSQSGDGEITNRTWRALIDHCPFVKPAFTYVPNELGELWRCKRFRLY